MNHHRNERSRGFTLVEVAIVLVVVGLLIGGLITPLSTQLEQRRVADTRRALEEARDALTGFAIRNGYLPCPPSRPPMAWRAAAASAAPTSAASASCRGPRWACRNWTAGATCSSTASRPTSPTAPRRSA
ncbi:type II secretion system protein [Pseudoduganella armeniaca]|uniref:type II secretion system protein n=1 Tax=Pseudoduganella armeniaca TaxID=2072590 RepID=UPI001E59A000|nr:prepilin-type N-terminal cleavage/methylation domain-containing protein [Pseudoduganella armeniaca]